MDELAHFQERELQDLMIASLDGDAGAYHHLWNSSPFICVPTTGSVSHELGTVRQKRRTFCRRHSSQFIRIARLYDRSRPFTHLDPCDRSIQISRRPRDRLRAEPESCLLSKRNGNRYAHRLVQFSGGAVQSKGFSPPGMSNLPHFGLWRHRSWTSQGRLLAGESIERH